MASTRSVRVVETIVSTLLVTIGVLGLLGRTNMLVNHLNVAAGSWLRWWPLALVVLGVMQIAVFSKRQGQNRKDSGAEENRP